jgi:hypothetical protein
LLTISGRPSVVVTPGSAEQGSKRTTSLLLRADRITE